jgi:hypothetical protein
VEKLWGLRDCSWKRRKGNQTNMRLLERMRKEWCVMAIVRAKLEPSFSVNRGNCLLCPFSTLRTWGLGRPWGLF